MFTDVRPVTPSFPPPSEIAQKFLSLDALNHEKALSLLVLIDYLIAEERQKLRASRQPQSN